MIFGITTSGGRRGQSNFDWRIKTIVFALASTLSAVAVGALLGLLGGLLSSDTRIALGALAAVALALVGVAYLLGHYRGMVQRNCETAQGWLDRGPLHWAIRNGAALGLGFMSRLGFVSWYVIPLACFLFGKPGLGAILFGLYGGLRGFAPVIWLVAFRAGVDQDRFVIRMFELNPAMQWASRRSSYGAGLYRNGRRWTVTSSARPMRPGMPVMAHDVDFADVAAAGADDASTGYLEWECAF